METLVALEHLGGREPPGLVAIVTELFRGKILMLLVPGLVKLKLAIRGKYLVLGKSLVEVVSPVLLPLHPAVLEPDFDLPVRQTHRFRHLAVKYRYIKCCIC